MVEGRAVIHRDTEKMEKEGDRNFMKFNKDTYPTGETKLPVQQCCVQTSLTGKCLQHQVECVVAVGPLNKSGSTIPVCVSKSIAKALWKNGYFPQTVTCGLTSGTLCSGMGSKIMTMTSWASKGP